MRPLPYYLLLARSSDSLLLLPMLELYSAPNIQTGSPLSCGAPEVQPYRSGLTQTRRVAEAHQLVTRYRRGQSFDSKLAGDASQSIETGSAQLDARLDGPHSYFIHRTATPACNAHLLSTPDRLPAPACVLSRCKPQACGRCLYAAVGAAGSIALLPGSSAPRLPPPG
jgi:hypothetical protein